MSTYDNRPALDSWSVGLMGDDPDTLRAAADYIGWCARLSIEPERMSIVRGV